MNKVFLIGRLANDPETRYTQGGQPVCQFRLAVQRRFANQEGVREADFLPVIAWRQLAELCGKYLAKGRQCAVIGTIQTRSYDAQDGTKRYVTEVIADEVEFLGDREKSADTGAQAPQNTLQQAQNTFGAGFVQVEDEALPF